MQESRSTSPGCQLVSIFPAYPAVLFHGAQRAREQRVPHVHLADDGRAAACTWLLTGTTAFTHGWCAPRVIPHETSHLEWRVESAESRRACINAAGLETLAPLLCSAPPPCLTLRCTTFCFQPVSSLVTGQTCTLFSYTALLAIHKHCFFTCTLYMPHACDSDRTMRSRCAASPKRLLARLRRLTAALAVRQPAASPVPWPWGGLR